MNYATSDSDAQNVVARITARGGRAAAVSKLADIQWLFDTAVKEFGKVDVLVNNAGYTNSVRWQPSTRITLTGGST